MPRCQASQPSQVLAAEPALCGLDSNEVRVSESLVVGVLGIVPAAIGVDEAREGLLLRRSAGKDDDPLGLRRVRTIHFTSMNLRPGTSVPKRLVGGYACQPLQPLGKGGVVGVDEAMPGGDAVQ